MDTLDICTVPTCPTMILSSIATKFVIAFCIMIGIATVSIER